MRKYSRQSSSTAAAVHWPAGHPPPGGTYTGPSTIEKGIFCRSLNSRDLAAVRRLRNVCRTICPPVWHAVSPGWPFLCRDEVQPQALYAWP